jgi:hypothetical protein
MIEGTFDEGTFLGPRWTFADALSRRSLPFDELQHVDLDLELCDTHQLGVQLALIGLHLGAEFVDERPESLVGATLANERGFDSED